MRIVVVDPRRTATCEGADLHLPLALGSDVALFSGLLAHLVALSDEVAITTAYAQTPDVAATARACGLNEADVATFFAWFAATPKVVTLFSQGVNQSTAGADKVNAIINVHVATGRIGLQGAGPFSITGQPNAMGGREVGALSNMLAAHLEWDRPGDADIVRAHWQAPNLASAPGRKAVELFRAIADKRIRAVWIMATNPAVSMPDSDAVREALRGCETVVISECMRAADSVDYAHIRLPALGWGEKNGTVTNSERVISRQRPFLPAPGMARQDWDIIADVARRMGWGAQFAWRGPADIFREHATLSGLGNDGGRIFDISALAELDDPAYDSMPPTRWPCPAGREATARLFTGGLGARLVPTPIRAPAHAVSANYPLLLNTGRIRDQWHTMTRTGKSARLYAHLSEPFLEIHPDDADGMEDQALVRVDSPHGHAVLRVRIDPGQRRGTVFAPMHWTDQFSPAGRVNPLVNDAVDPVSGQPELKHTPVHIAPYVARWHGFILSAERLSPKLAEWSAIFPSGEAWRHELAGQKDPTLEFARLRDACTVAGAWLVLQDPAHAVFRAALIDDGKLRAVVFLGRTSALPPRDWLISLFARDRITTAERRALLAGRPANGPVPEQAVCVCFGIGAREIGTAIGGGCETVEEVGAATRAGTNCGSCRPEIRALLAKVAA
jgi:assimilatory nitrate reductase catalytic subunit